MSAKVSKASVDYRPAKMSAAQKCGNCSMFRTNYCTLVTGHISATAVCNRWAKKK